MEVEYFEKGRLEIVKAPMKGSIRGRGKKDAWVDVGSFVILNETGVVGTMAYDIVMPLNPLQVNKLRKEGQIDEHFFEKQATGEDIEFETAGDEAPAEINVDTI